MKEGGQKAYLRKSRGTHCAPLARDVDGPMTGVCREFQGCNPSQWPLSKNHCSVQGEFEFRVE